MIWRRLRLFSRADMMLMNDFDADKASRCEAIIIYRSAKDAREIALIRLALPLSTAKFPSPRRQMQASRRCHQLRQNAAYGTPRQAMPSAPAMTRPPANISL